MTETIDFSFGDCPVCGAKDCPLRQVRNRNGMVAWICDPCLTRFNNKGSGGKGIRTQ